MTAIQTLINVLRNLALATGNQAMLEQVQNAEGQHAKQIQSDEELIAGLRSDFDDLKLKVADIPVVDLSGVTASLTGMDTRITAIEARNATDDAAAADAVSPPATPPPVVEPPPPPGPVTLSPTSVSADLGVAADALVGAGGAGPYTFATSDPFTNTSGSLSSDGVFTGTAAGSDTVNVVATDSLGAASDPTAVDFTTVDPAA